MFVNKNPEKPIYIYIHIYIYTEMNAQTLCWLACNNLYIDYKDREREGESTKLLGIYK